MTAFNITYNAIFRLVAFVALILFICYFPDVLTYLFLAFILMLLGRPLAKAICKIRVYKYQIPRSIAAAITILVFVLVLLVSVTFFYTLSHPRIAGFSEHRL